MVDGRTSHRCFGSVYYHFQLKWFLLSRKSFHFKLYQESQWKNKWKKMTSKNLRYYFQWCFFLSKKKKNLKVSAGISSRKLHLIVPIWLPTNWNRHLSLETEWIRKGSEKTEEEREEEEGADCLKGYSSLCID